MKDSVLQALRQSDGFVSGQKICALLGVTRAAVWKAVQMLRSDGYLIEAQPRRGYRLAFEPDRLDRMKLAELLTTCRIGRSCEILAQVDSTNTLCRTRAREGASDGLVIAAEHQTAGRGRSGRTWHSDQCQALQFSLLLRPALPPSRAALITQIGAAAMAQAIVSAGFEPQIKWPNDLLLNGKKVCGILTEMSCELDRIHWVIMGVGLNVNQTDFPPDIEGIATSLAAVSGKTHDRTALLAKFLNAFEPLFDDYLANPASPQALEICRRRSSLTGREISFTDDAGLAQKAIVLGIDSVGRLEVRLADGQLRRLLSGEVHLGHQK